MKKLTTLIAGLSLAIGSIGVTFAADEKKAPAKKADEKKAKKSNKKNSGAVAAVRG